MPSDPASTSPLADSSTPPASREHAGLDKATLFYRLFFLAITWIAALVAACPHAEGILLFPMFPAGLARILSSEPGSHNESIALGWVIYACVSLGALTAGRKFWFYAFYAVLVGMLLTNVTGCHLIRSEVSSIQ